MHFNCGLPAHTHFRDTGKYEGLTSHQPPCWGAHSQLGINGCLASQQRDLLIPRSSGEKGETSDCRLQLIFLGYLGWGRK